MSTTVQKEDLNCSEAFMLLFITHGRSILKILKNSQLDLFHLLLLKLCHIFSEKFLKSDSKATST